MKIEDQVCSLELAQRLKELNVKQDSYFCYGRIEDPTFKRTTEGALFNEELAQWNDTCSYFKYCSAFTVAELGEMLPDWSEISKRMKNDWICTVRHKNSDRNDHSFDGKEANARAKMLIHLIENKLININELNKE